MTTDDVKALASAYELQARRRDEDEIAMWLCECGTFEGEDNRMSRIFELAAALEAELRERSARDALGLEPAPVVEDVLAVDLGAGEVDDE